MAGSHDASPLQTEKAMTTTDTIENASETGHFVITTYRHSGKITFVGERLDWDAGGIKDDPSSEYGRYMRDDKEICLSPPEHRGGEGNFLGDWYYHLNDGPGLMDVGPFQTELVAVSDARRNILHFRDVMGDRVHSVSHNGDDLLF
jgi:hypothetical protein